MLFEIATLSPGFAVDEDPEHLGEALRLPEAARAPARAARAHAAPRRQPARAGARRRAMSALTYRERPAAGDAAGPARPPPRPRRRRARPARARRRARPRAAAARRHAARAAARSPAGRATTGTSCRASAIPDPDTFHAAYARARRASTTSCGSAPASTPEQTVLRRLLDGLGDELLARPRRATARRPPASSPSPASSRSSRAGSPTSPTAPALRAFIAHGRQRPGHGRRLRARARASCSRPAGSTSSTTSPTPAHHIDPAHVPAAVDWLATTLAPVSRRQPRSSEQVASANQLSNSSGVHPLGRRAGARRRGG